MFCSGWHNTSCHHRLVTCRVDNESATGTPIRHLEASFISVERGLRQGILSRTSLKHCFWFRSFLSLWFSFANNSKGLQLLAQHIPFMLGLALDLHFSDLSHQTFTLLQQALPFLLELTSQAQQFLPFRFWLADIVFVAIVIDFNVIVHPVCSFYQDFRGQSPIQC